MHGKGLPQSMSFTKDYYNRKLAGKPKGTKRVLKERGLWPERGLMLECPTTHNRSLMARPRGGGGQEEILEKRNPTLAARVRERSGLGRRETVEEQR